MSTKARASNIERAEVIQVIRVFSVCGSGEPHDPYRSLIEYWSLDGELLARKDVWLEGQQSIATARGVKE